MFSKKGRRILILISIIITFISFDAFSQDEEITCGGSDSRKAEKQYKEALGFFKKRNYNEAKRILKEILDSEPEYADANFLFGMISTLSMDFNYVVAEKYFRKTIEICPEYKDPYVFFYLGDFAYSDKKYEEAYNFMSKFMKDVDKVKSDEDYNRAEAIYDYSKFYYEVFKNPVPFNPVYVKGISTKSDEYFIAISPDNETVFFTRKEELPPEKTAWASSDIKYKEKFMYSNKGANGEFDAGDYMPEPFNLRDNEGGPTLTIDNKELYYTVCAYKTVFKNGAKRAYYNCDICYSKLENDQWSEIKPVELINNDSTWESQASLSSDGKRLYFVSDRAGGYGGCDIYVAVKDSSGNWSKPKNVGPVINTSWDEKAPFVHTDRQTLYFSSQGHMGIGGFDIFYSKIKDNGTFEKPKNIGYPINTENDEVGFIVSTDGKTGYFASNKYNGPGGWDFYSFELYKDARPEKVLFIKGEVKDEKTNQPVKANIELKNAATKEITEIPVDTATGKYVAAVLFKDDYLLTVKKEGYAYDTKYISQKDTAYEAPAKVDLQVQVIETGKSYKLNDIYYTFDSDTLTKESELVIDEFIEFLNKYPHLVVSIHGHTDNIGTPEYNLTLSENRAKSVYDYLISQGIDASRLSFKGFGETIPVDSNYTAQGRAKNRRTEFVIINQ